MAAALVCVSHMASKTVQVNINVPILILFEVRWENVLVCEQSDQCLGEGLPHNLRRFRKNFVLYLQLLGNFFQNNRIK